MEAYHGSAGNVPGLQPLAVGPIPEKDGQAYGNEWKPSLHGRGWGQQDALPWFW